MKRLIIKAHPGEYGFTHKIVETIKKVSEKSGDECFVVDLYMEEWQQSFLSFQKKDLSDTNEREKRIKIQEKISWSDEVVFVAPMWWSGMPAVMKNFIDHNLSIGFAFKFENGKIKKLLVGKSVRVFMTSDGPDFVYKILKPFFAFTTINFIFGFCGLKTKSFTIFGSMLGKRNDKDRRGVLKKVERVLSK